MLSTDAPRLIDLRSTIESPVGRTLFRLVESPIDRMLSVSTINKLYRESLALRHYPNYFSSALRVLNIEYDLTDEDRAKIPTEGPVLVVANHPFGGIDGVVLGDILCRLRPDVRLLGNHWLAEIPEVRENVTPVDPWGGNGAVQANIGPLKSCLRWLRGGGILGAFPSGTVSHLRVREARVSDPSWH